VGRCGKGDLQVMLKEGGEVDIDVLGEKSGVGRSGVVGAPV
jgi:hypothetical protein